MERDKVSQDFYRLENIYRLRFYPDGTLKDRFHRMLADRAYNDLCKELDSALGTDGFGLRWKPILEKIENDFRETRAIVCAAWRETNPLWSATHPYVVLKQNSVGHGGFHTGTLGSNEYRIRWVYDCGSWKNGKRLQKCIEDFRKRATDLGRLQLLFISHFDADHVSGIRSLLEAFRDRIDVVVIPYLSSDDVLGVVGRSIATSRYSEDFFDQVVDPVAWLKQYGVKRIVRLKPPSADRGRAGEPDTPQIPRPPRLASPPEMAALTFLDPKGNEFSGTIAKAGTIAGVNTNEGWADWWFVPFVHPVSRTSKRNFTRAAKQKIERLGRGRTFRAKLVDVLKTKAGRRTLKELYAAEKIGDANAISLSLYEGPLPTEETTRVLYTASDNSVMAQAGWLLTGDSKLRQDDRRLKWLEFFHPFKRVIGTVMLPHHGSIHNFHKELLRVADDNARLFITADSDDQTRPNREVKKQVQRRRILKISNKSTSTLIDVSGHTSYIDHRPPLADW